MANFLGLLAFTALIAAQFLAMVVASQYQHEPADAPASTPATGLAYAHDRA